MQATQHIFYGVGVVVLHKISRNACCLHKLFIEALVKEAARISENFGFHDKHVRNVCLNYLH